MKRHHLSTHQPVMFPRARSIDVSRWSPRRVWQRLNHSLWFWPVVGSLTTWGIAILISLGCWYDLIALLVL